MLKCIICSAALLVGAMPVQAGDISEVFGPASNPKRADETAANPAPPTSYVGQWYTTPDKCSYSRAQAPGYKPTWHLILNPHHIGQPDAHAGCPVMLQSW